MYVPGCRARHTQLRKRKFWARRESHVCWGRFPAQKGNGVQMDLPTSPRHPGAQEPGTMARKPHGTRVTTTKKGGEERPRVVSSDSHHLGVRGCSPEPPGSQAQAQPGRQTSCCPTYLTRCHQQSVGHTAVERDWVYFPLCPLWSVFSILSP